MSRLDSGTFPVVSKPVSDGDARAGAGATPHALDIARVLTRSWELFTAEPLTYVLAGAILIVAGTLTLGILAPPLAVGFIRMVDRQMRGERIETGQILDGLRSFADAFLAGLCIAVGVAVASAFLVLPGVILAVLWGYALHFVALRGLRFAEALTASWRLVWAHVGSVLLVLLCALALNVLGGMVVLGALLSAPLALISITVSFDELARL